MINRISYQPLDQKGCLEIVAGLARERGIKLPEAELKEEAILPRWHAGRTARQFVSELESDPSRRG